MSALNAYVTGNYIIVQARSAKAQPLLSLARSAAGSVRFVNGSLRLELTPDNALLLHRTRQTVDLATDSHLDAYIASCLQDEEAREAALRGSDEAETFPFKTVPFPHQMQGWRWSRDLEAAAYFLKPGLGKTKITLDVAHWAWSKGRIKQMLVIAPSGVHSEWISDQVPKHLGCPYVAHVISTRTRADFVQRIFERNKDNALIVWSINAEALSAKSGEKLTQFLVSLGQTMVVVDESSLFKNPTAKRTRALMTLRDKAVMRRILDGTPVSKGVEDLYAPLTFLRPGITGCSTFTSFKSRYCVVGGYTGWDVVGYKNLDALYSQIRPYVYQPDVQVALPDKLIIERMFSLDDSERSMYRRLRESIILELEQGSLTVAQGASKAIKLSQVTSGFLLGEDTEIAWKAESPSRLQMFCAIAQELRHYQFVVFAWFRAEIAMVQRALAEMGIPCAVYETADAEQTLSAFRSGKIQALLCQYQSGSVGLNLQNASYGIFYSPTLSARLRWQAEARLHREGQKNTVVFFELLARNSLDLRWKQLREQKESLAEMTRQELLFMLEEEP